ncbi:MarC family protein [Arcobacter sp.]|uniref:MarC family protein n=1 Tax=Arcobacter sp. TaxID=1872629 RepID=UPI003D13CE2B
MDFIQNFLQHSITFFAIMDPIGVSAIALSLLSENITKIQISTIAKKSSLTIVIAFFVVLITGDLVLKIFSISENSLKVMGGIILIMTAITMVNGSSKEKTPSDSKMDEEKAIIPIGIPIAFGTGLFTTIIIFKSQAENFTDIISIALAFSINALIFYFVLKNSIYIKKYLGAMGQSIITKLMGLVVGAIAIQFIVSGVVHLAKSYL